MVKLSDVCDVRDGTHDSPKYVEYGYPLVTSKNIKDGQLDLSIVNFITEEDYNKINERSKVDVGDIIMPMIGTIGNPYLVEEFCDFAIKNVALIKCDNIKVINKFVWYFLQSNAFERYVDTKNKGGTQKFLSLGDIRAIELPEVSTVKQKNIIEILTRVDGIVAKRKKQLQKLDELVKARFIEMFGDPKFSKQYSTRKLSSCVANKSDLVDGPFGSQVNTKTDYIDNGEIPVIRTINVKMMRFSSVDLKYMSREKYETVIRSQVLPGDIILTKVGTIGNVCIFPEFYKEAVLSTTGSCRIRVDDKTINKVFLAYNLMYLKESLLEVASTGVQPFLNMNHIKNIEIFDVPKKQQNEFADFVRQVDKSNLSVQKSLDKLKLLKKALMQKYFG